MSIPSSHILVSKWLSPVEGVRVWSLEKWLVAGLGQGKYKGHLYYKLRKYADISGDTSEPPSTQLKALTNLGKWESSKRLMMLFLHIDFVIYFYTLILLKKIMYLYWQTDTLSLKRVGERRQTGRLRYRRTWISTNANGRTNRSRKITVMRPPI